MRIFFTLIIFLLVGCTQPKALLICGDHICINKKEANQYFEENLSLEVKIINNDKDEIFDLVELNLKEDTKKNKKVFVKKKKKTNNKIKKLSNTEIEVIKTKIKNHRKNTKVAKKINKDKRLKNRIYEKKKHY